MTQIVQSNNVSNTDTVIIVHTEEKRFQMSGYKGNLTREA